MLSLPHCLRAQIYLPWLSRRDKTHMVESGVRRRQWRSELAKSAYRLSYYCEFLMSSCGVCVYVSLSAKT